MVNIRQLLKDWEDSPAFSDFIDLDKFIDSNVFRTKSGQLGCVLAVKGIDYESVPRDQLDVLTERLQRNFHTFDPGTRVYQYFTRTSRPTIPHREYSDTASSKFVHYRLADLESKINTLYETQVYLAVLTKIETGDTAPQSLWQRVKKFVSDFSARKVTAVSLANQDIARAALLQKVSTFTAATSDFAAVTMLDEDGIWHFYRALLNPNPQLRDAPMPEGAGTFPAFFAADSTLRAFPTHLELDDYFVKVLTLKGLPNNTHPNILGKLLLVPGNYHVVSTWAPEYQHQTAAHADSIIDFNEATKSRATATPQRQIGPPRVKKSKDAISDKLEEVGEEIAVRDAHYGHYSLSIVVYHRDAAQLEGVIEAFINAAQSINVSLFTESDFTNLVFLATFPGAHRYNHRTLRISSANYADLSFFYSIDTGKKFNSFLKDEYLAIFTTESREPFYFNLHSGEVAHTLLVGPTGTGKSFICNYLLGQASKYNPYMTIIDMGGSYRFLTESLQGNYTNFTNTERNFRLNPFRLPQNQSNMDFLTTLVSVLIEMGGGALDDKLKNEIYQKVSQLYAVSNPSLRTLTTLSRTLPASLSDRLTRWLRGGQYGYIFDNPDGEDALSFSKVQTFNFDGFDMKTSDYLQPVIFYLLHNSSQIVGDPNLLDILKIFHLDEAFQFFRSLAVREHFSKAQATWRKRNAFTICATQNIEQLEESGVLKDIATNSPTKLFLANRALNIPSYQAVFDMPADTAAQIKTLIPCRQMLMFQDADMRDERVASSLRLTKILNLEVDPIQYWLYANSAPENLRRSEALAKFHGNLDAALQYLARDAQHSAA